MDLLTTSGINSLISNYKIIEQRRRIIPLETRKDKYSGLSNAWGDLKSKMSTLKSLLANLKSTSSTSIFNARSATSDSEYVTATASNNATVGAHSIRVSQLAKSDLLVSNTMLSDTAVTTLAGTHTIAINSGDYVSTFDITLTGTETNDSIMDSIASALNADKAVVTSAELNASTSFNGSGSFDIDIDGTTTTIDYDYSSGKTYDEVMDDLVTQINSDTSGITAEKVTNGSNVSLKLTVEDSSKYITIDSTTDTGTLLNGSNLNINISKEKGASGLASASVFAPTTDNSKISFTAKSTGYDNRLIMSDSAGSLLNFVGLTSSILTNRTANPDDDTAGFLFTANSIADNELNSEFTFNGINIKRNSNVVSDLVSNLSIELKSVMDVADPDANISVGIDKDKIKSKIQEFIDDFNAVYTFVKNKSGNDKTSRGIFVGDSAANSLMNTFSNLGHSAIAGIADGNLNYLVEIGITFDTQIGLTISDSTKLETSINENQDQVASLFNSDSGIANSLTTTIEQYINADGVISDLQENYDKNVTYLTDKITAQGKRIEKSAGVLRKQYENLQMQLASIMQTSGFFSQSNQGFF